MKQVQYLLYNTDYQRFYTKHMCLHFYTMDISNGIRF